MDRATEVQVSGPEVLDRTFHQRALDVWMRCQELGQAALALRPPIGRSVLGQDEQPDPVGQR
jgi:hypothetical protein